MSDYISREAASADSDRNKIKTPFARIVVEGTPGKPYYNIWYFDPADGECHIGFGLYCLDNVFNWLAEEFEITEPHTDVAPVVHGVWIPVHESEISGWNPEVAGIDPIDGYICSACKNEAVYDCNDKFVLSDYCPWCGARMDGGAGNETD